MVVEDIFIYAIGAALAAWNGYLHLKMRNLCNDCVHDFTPKVNVSGFLKRTKSAS